MIRHAHFWNLPSEIEVRDQRFSIILSEIEIIEQRFGKFPSERDATINARLIMINLIGAGFATYNVKNHVPSNIPVHNQIIDSDNLQAQEYLHKVGQWTEERKMKLNSKKTKCMIINPSWKKQFTTNLKLQGEPI